MGTSRTARYMVSPDLWWMMTPVSLGMFDARALPLVGMQTSLATGTRFHSDDACGVEVGGGVLGRCREHCNTTSVA